MSVPIPKLAGVCGWPIHHSLSPLLHQFWLDKMKIKGGYVSFAVHPDEAVEAFRSLKNMNLQGVNVTAPLKLKAFMAADKHTPEAKKLGVANCLYKREGQLIAHNTDIEGFTTPLLKKLDKQFLKTNPAIIFGAGGAAKACLGALLDIGIPEIRLCSRRNSPSALIVEDVNLPNVYNVAWDDRQASLKTAGLIINATTAGMHGRRALDIDLSSTRSDAFIYDLVYTPMITPLIEQAKTNNRAYLGGLDMLIEQARPSFEMFYNERPHMTYDPTALLMAQLGEVM